MGVRVFDLLAIDPTAPPDAQLDEAIARWPRDKVQPVTGDVFHDEDYRDLLLYLQQALDFQKVRPGAAPDRVGLHAELHVDNGLTALGRPLSIVLAAMPDYAFFLQDTRGVPAHVFVTQGATGVELVLEGLAVELQVPPGLFRPRRTKQQVDSATTDLPDVVLTEPFDPRVPDSFSVTLRDFDPSSIVLRINVRMTEELDFIVDSMLPISFGPCLFMDLPCAAIHDLQLIPSPRLQKQHLLPVEWARHRLDALSFGESIMPGVIAMRTLELDQSVDPLAELTARIKGNRAAADPIELVAEDVAIPVFSANVPVPCHGRFGLRRLEVEDPAQAAAEAYQLQSAPIQLPLGGWRLEIFRLLLQTAVDATASQLASIINADLVLTAGEDTTQAWSAGVTITDEGVVILDAILPADHRLHLFKVLDRDIALAGVKLGYSILDPEQVKGKPAFVVPAGFGEWAKHLILMLDFEIRSPPPDASKSQVAIRNKSGSDLPKILHDLGWYLGKWSLGALVDPDGIDLVIADKLKLHIEELGYLTENNGADYLVFSGALDFPIGQGAVADGSHAGSAGSADSLERGGGLRLLRLRVRAASAGAPDPTPAFLLDGISLYVKTSRVTIAGFGALTESEHAGTRYHEMALGARVAFDAFGKQFDLSFQIVYGHASGVQNFTYWMFAFELGWLPVGATHFKNVRFLLAGDMSPRLDPPDGNDQPMRLYRWYKQHGDALTLPSDRTLRAWQVESDSWAFGFGARLLFAGTDAVQFDGFFFLHASPDEKGMFAGLEVYFGKGDKPIAYGALEWDIERASWGATLGVNLGLENVLGPTLPGPLKRLAALTGVLYFGRNIDVIAIGQYGDPSTWLTAKLEWPGPGAQGGIWGSFCLHRVDRPEGPDVLAIVLGGKLTADIGFGALKLYATLSLTHGRWRNEALASGTVLHIEAGIRIRVFHVFNFGASIVIEGDWLGPSPTYHRYSMVFRIETPWWLPDITVRWEQASGAPQPSAAAVLSVPVNGAEAIDPGKQQPKPVGITPLLDAGPKGRGVFSMDALRGAPPAAVSDADRAAVPPVGVDATIAIAFKASLDAPVTVVPDTPAGVGTQKSGELEASYALVAIGIRRRPRFTAGAVWTDLLDPLTTRIDSLDGLPPDPALQAMFSTQIRCEWDRDVVREQRLDPRRLLINAETPYSLVSSNPEEDDVAAQEPGWPCCQPSRGKITWHTVVFSDTPYGVRVPATQRFTDSASTLHWQGGPAPVVAPPLVAPAGSHPALIHIGARPEGIFAVASFDQRVARCQLQVYWPRARAHDRLIIDAFDGLSVVKSQTFDMAGDDPSLFELALPAGFTSLTLRKAAALAIVVSTVEQVELVMIRYRTVREELDAVISREKCQAADGRVHGQGRLAWLPNHDYEISLTTRIAVTHTPSGTQSIEVEQKTHFRTKGLPGLNLVDRIGDELEPYVESRYAGPDPARLYRKEPLALAFDERFNILVPVDRTPDPSRPEEANQLLEWVLAVERVGGQSGNERLSQTAPDWVAAHRALPPPHGTRVPVVIGPGIFSAAIRSARTRNPQKLRLAAMMDRPGGCPQRSVPERSQVLIHLPVDPGAPDATVPRWEPERTLRVNLRRKDAPFVDRASFDDLDAGAFTPAAETGAPASWRSDAGALRADGAAAATQLALFGEPDWRHLQIRTIVDPEAGAAGVAVVVASSGAAMKILIDAATRSVRIVERVAGVDTVRAEQPLPDGAAAPYPLEVIAFDDAVRAAVGELVLTAPLEALRAGRLALVARGGGRFSRLAVDGLDAYRFEVQTSRYDDFPSHIQSFDGTLRLLQAGDAGAPLATAAALLHADSPTLQAVMTPAGDPEARQRLFDRWTSQLALPISERPPRLGITRFVEPTGTALLLIESPEPLALSRDVSIALFRRRRVLPPFPLPGTSPALAAFLADLDIGAERIVGPRPPGDLRGLRRILLVTKTANVLYDVTLAAAGLVAHRAGTLVKLPRGLEALSPGELVFLDAGDRPLVRPIPPLPTFIYVPVAIRRLTNRAETAVLVIATGATPDVAVPLTAATYRIDFAIDRIRYRAELPDTDSSYRAAASIFLTLA